jgi:hypothetical protein
VPEAAVPTGAALRTDAHGRADPAQRQLASLASARRRALAELDQLYVENAGLVLLWPFLERFFLRVGLLDPSSRFHDELSALRAVSLLGQIVFEDPEPPEFLLPLAKVLCGLSPEAHFELELTLNAEQLAECERLLSAAIDHAPSLRALPTAQFRATFLQRRAALSVREGTWLLQVERRAEDALLDRLPWSWSWLKLPWMAGALQVEW